jgi:hypothetical protein
MGVLNPQVGEICRALYVGRGEVSAPSLSFEARPGTGFFLQGDNEISVAIGGVEVFTFGDAIGVLDFGGATITFPTATATLYGTGTGTITSAQLLASLSDETGTGLAVFATTPTLTTPVIGAATGTSLALTGAFSNGTAVTPGTGTSDAAVRDSGVWTQGTVIYTRILVDMTNLVGSTTDLDIIGNTAAATAHIGQITTAVNGVIQGGTITCLEVPAGGTNDIDFYAATESTGTENALVTGLTETVMVTSGAAWTAGRILGIATTGNPAANSYIYMANGAAGVPGTFTAGIFLIELYGT